ncbi:MAG: glycosyltransferase family 2 protein [Blastocatellales bacterium]
MPNVSRQPLVYIIVLNYRMREQVVNCVRSLLQISYPNYQIVVVDNKSEDGIEEVFGREFPSVTVIQTGGNSGYTGGNNAGIRRALDNGADYVLIVNPDTVVINPRFVEEMVGYLESHPKIGIAGPRVFLRERGSIQNTVLFAPGLWRNTVNWFRYRTDPKSLEFSGEEVMEAEALNGVCLLIRAECLRQAGLFDENIFMYIEDAEMDYRARAKGWRVSYLPIDSVIHLQKQDGYHMTGMVSFLLKRNSVYFLCKTGKRMDAWSYAVISLALLIVRGVFTFNFKRFVEYWVFTRKLAIAYHRILFGYQPDEYFGPPFAKWS